MKADIVIIGAGISGMSIARELSRYELSILVLDSNADVGWGVSKANTALIHGGYDDDPERYPNRARLCVRGNSIWKKLVEELDIPHIWNGALVLGKEGDEPTLKKLLHRGERNGVQGMRILSREEVLEMEPHVSSEVVSALWIPSVGQISPARAVIALAENSVENGVRILLEAKVTGISRRGDGFALETTRGSIEGKMLINAAGLHADEISAMLGYDHFSITPRKGEYVIFRKTVEPKPRHVLFPAPTPISKGVVVTTEISGHLMVGPNARDVEDKEDFSTTPQGLREVLGKAREIWPPTPSMDHAIRTFAGLRPEPTGGDFIIEERDGFINVAGIRSPGLTAAPAIAKEVVEIVKEGMDLREKSSWKPTRRGIKKVSVLSVEDRKALVARDERYGRIVCRCNGITEGEILDAIQRMKMIGVRTPTLDSIKFRTGVMAGGCQGATCRLEIASILSREFKVPISRVTLKGRGSELGVVE